MKNILAVALAFGCATGACALEVNNVTAAQRKPWANIIDIDYEISGAAAGERFAISVTATYNGGKTLTATNYVSEPIGVAGQNSVAWDIGADAPGLKAADMAISVTATTFGDDTPVYCVIDLSEGKNATRYPVRYKTCALPHVKGATDEPCQTTELWLRRIPAQGRTFVFNYWKYTSSKFYVTFSKDYYLSVFETTQQQHYLIKGTWPSWFSNETCRASRPVDSLWLDDIRNSAYPKDKSPGNNKPVDLMRKKTGLATFDVQSEAEYEFCAQGDTTGEFYRYGKKAVADIARTSANNGGWSSTVSESNPAPYYCDLSKGTAAVGSYEPNKWGIYDLMGNVCDLCRDSFWDASKVAAYYAENNLGTTKDTAVCDYNSLSQDITSVANYNHSRRGGSFRQGNDYATCFWRGPTNNTRAYNDGYRFSFTCER
jgi:formylglycine-generating enzyme required for sulfatase activity